MKTDIKHLLFVLALLPALRFQLSTVFAQGSLTPPGAPAPTMKSLDQVEPRTPISSIPFTIMVPGVYYLTTSLSNSSNGILIGTNDVTLDLMGFTLTGDGSGGLHTGIDIGNSATLQRQRVVVRNGTIRNFGIGINFDYPVSEAVADGLLVAQCQYGVLFGASISAAQRDCIVRNCLVVSNSYGVVIASGPVPGGQIVISDCQAVNNSQYGFQILGTNNLIIRNFASGNLVADYEISANNRAGTIVRPAVTTNEFTNGGPGSGTTDPFANLRY